MLYQNKTFCTYLHRISRNISCVSAVCWKYSLGVQEEKCYILVNLSFRHPAEELLSKLNWHLVKCDWTSVQRGIEDQRKWIRKRTCMTQPAIQWRTWKETGFFESLVKLLRSCEIQVLLGVQLGSKVDQRDWSWAKWQRRRTFITQPTIIRWGTCKFEWSNEGINYGWKKVISASWKSR